MRNVDFIYLINLDNHPEKLKACLNQLTPYGVHPYRFSAVNGLGLSLATINDLGLKVSNEMERGTLGIYYPLEGNFEFNYRLLTDDNQTYFNYWMTRENIGKALSHISILQDALDSGYETIWVMEDDIQVVRDPREISELIDRLDQQVGKDNWDILFTDQDQQHQNGHYTTTFQTGQRPDYAPFAREIPFKLKEKIGSDFFRIGARSGSYSMVLRKSGIRKLLQYFHARQLFSPYDIEYAFPRGIRLYTVDKEVVSTISEKNGTGEIKLLVLITASDDLPVYVEHQKVWKSYMHLDPLRVETFFMKANPDLIADYEIQDDVIWCKTEDILTPGALNKTLLSIECLFPRIGEFDYVLRTNLSSFYYFPRLLDFIKSLPREKCYCAVPVSLAPDDQGAVNIGSGAGFILSKDLAEMFLRAKPILFNCTSTLDDCVIGGFFRNQGISLISAERMDFLELNSLLKEGNPIPEKYFHFRCKNDGNSDPSSRLLDELSSQKQLLKQFYGISIAEEPN